MFVFIARLIVFLVAISAIRMAIRFVQQAWSGTLQHRHRAPDSAVNSGNAAGSTMLQQDPVCGTYVAVDSSLKRIANGRVIHFCSPECRDKYKV